MAMLAVPRAALPNIWRLPRSRKNVKRQARPAARQFVFRISALTVIDKYHTYSYSYNIIII